MLKVVGISLRAYSALSASEPALSSSVTSQLQTRRVNRIIDIICREYDRGFGRLLLWACCQVPIGNSPTERGRLAVETPPYSIACTCEDSTRAPPRLRASTLSRSMRLRTYMYLGTQALQCYQYLDRRQTGQIASACSQRQRLATFGVWAKVLASCPDPEEQNSKAE